MRDELLEQILVCPSLPSLPAVALRVIELAGKSDVVMKELASTIEQDQGLAAKVLRTVNSSFYSVRTKCSTISKALVLLGLGPVKTLSLGFSLVSAVAPVVAFAVASAAGLALAGFQLVPFAELVAAAERYA